MKTIVLNLIVGFGIFSILLLTGCSNNNKTEKKKLNDVQIEVNDLQETSSNFENSFNPPSPDEVMAFFETTLITYNPEILNKVDRVSNYFDSKSQALNLGIYLSDVAYINLFDNSTDAMHYMEAVFVLSEKLNISAAYNDDAVSRLMSNISNQDSTMKITEEIYFSLIDYLTKNQRENILALVSIGSYIEILHLTLESVGEYSADNPILEQIEDLNILLENIFLYAERYTIDMNVEKAFGYLQSIQNILNELSIKEAEVNINNEASENNKLVISGGTDYEMSEATYNKLRAEVEKIRSSIIQ